MNMRTRTDSWGRKINFKHSYNLKVFQKKNALFYYLLGAYITDGNVFFYRNGKSCKTTISSKDIDWLQMINDIICEDNLISLKEKRGELRITDPEIGKILDANGCHPNKSLTVKLPDIPEKYFRDFIRGSIDGDGSITLPQKKVVRPYKTYSYKVPTAYLCSASKEFIDAISIKLISLGLKHYVITLKPKRRKIRDTTINSTTPMYRILFNGEDCYHLINWLYYSDELICMTRKKKIAHEIIDYWNSKVWGKIAQI